jgi:hypothetical protein
MLNNQNMKIHITEKEIVRLLNYEVLGKKEEL